MEFFLEKSSFKKITDNQKRPIKPHAYILNFVDPHTKTLFRKGKSHTTDCFIKMGVHLFFIYQIYPNIYHGIVELAY